MSLSNVSSQCPISSPLTLPLDSCCRTIACFFCSNVWKYISAICIIRSLHCSFYRKLSVCSFQGTNCDNHSIMVIYGLKWTFPSDWRLSFSFTLWAQVDSNHRPHAYQACALTSWAISPYSFLNLAATYSPTPSPVQYHRPFRSLPSCSGWERVLPLNASPPKALGLSEVFSSLVLSLFSALGDVLSNLVRRTSLYLITQQ